MPNRNIYFKVEQHEKMVMFPNINWSEVCQKAVDQKLEELKPQIEKARTYENRSALMI